MEAKPLDEFNLPAEGPILAQAGVFHLVLCVPADYTDEQSVAFGEEKHPAGTSGGWSPSTDEAHQNLVCPDRAGYKHIVLYV
jgi:hypothetical protein